MKKHQSRIPFWQLAPEILKYQIVTKIILAVLLAFIRFAALTLLHSTGRVAVSSGDYRFLFITWQGPLMIFLFLAVFFFFVSIDLNVKILYSGNVISGVTEPVFRTIQRAAASLPALFNIHGLGVILYVTLISPIVGAGLGVSLTKNLKIPNFISSVIETTPLYNTIYLVLVIVFTVTGFSHIFCLHGMLLDGLSIRESRKRSSSLIRRHWRNFLWENLKYTLFMAAIAISAVVLFFIIPLIVVETISVDQLLRRGLTILLLLLGVSGFSFASLFITPLYILRITRLYRAYLEERPIPIPTLRRGSYLLPALLCTAVVLMFTAIYPCFCDRAVS